MRIGITYNLKDEVPLAETGEEFDTPVTIDALCGVFKRHGFETVKLGGSLDIIERLEQSIGKPAICSNQAMIWDTLRLAGIEDRIDGFGCLLRDH